MDLAILAVQSGLMTKTAAAEKYGVACSTLRDKLLVRRDKKGACNRKFTEKEEMYLAEILLRCADIGVPFTKRLLKRLIPKLARAKGYVDHEVPFSDKWHRHFLSRHPNVSRRISHAKSRSKAREWTVESCGEWIDLLSDLHMTGYLDNPEGIWNFDETAFKIAESVSIVYARRGVKDVISYFDGNDRELITVLAGGNASGEILRPLVLFDGKVFLASRFEGTDSRCWLGVNSSGVMDNDTFCNYMRQEVFPNLTAEKNVIFLDGHSSHVGNYEFLSECVLSPHNIKVVRFPSGQTSKLQPMDVKVFGPVKKTWADFLRDQNLFGFGEVSKQNFARHLMDKWLEFNMESNIKSGFFATGIYPFSPENICKTVLPLPPTQPALENLPVSFKDVYAMDLQDMRVILRRMNLTETVVEKVIAFTTQHGDGFNPTIPAADLAKEIRDNIMEAHPPKKPRTTDTRLKAKKAAICTEASFMEAVLEKKQQKKKTAKRRNGSKKNAG